MTIPLESIPSLTAAEALEIAKKEYGIEGAISALPSERDQNFLISRTARMSDAAVMSGVAGMSGTADTVGAVRATGAHATGSKFVLKIANLHDTPQLLDFQNQAMRRVRENVGDCRVPRVERTLAGLEIGRVRNARTNTDHCVRLLDWIEGEVLANSAERGAALLASIGAGMAAIDAALYSYSHPDMGRVLQWDLRRADMALENAELLPNDKRAHVERLFSLWERIDWTGLRHSVIHGDANDYNIIVSEGHMVGLLDFGDMVYTATVCDLAIALAYVMLGEQEPLPVAAQVIRAYQRCYPLTVAEQLALYPLVLSRLAMSVCYSAHNRARNPDDPYQVVTEAAAWQLLDRLAAVPTKEVLELTRTACAVT
ncbi:MAG: phosphotransferase [Gammaproteobacteria bacterium]